MPYKDLEAGRAYHRAWRKAHPEESKAYDHAYREAHREKRRAYREAHREESLAWHRAYREEHREKRVAYSHAYYEMHREESLAYDHAYNEAHREWRVAYRRAYYETHREGYRASSRAWAKAHPQKMAEAVRRRQARTRGATVGPIDIAAIKVRDRMMCCICGKKVSERDFSLDHTVPLVLGGAHSQDNLRVAHRRCNSRRGAGRLPVQMVLV